MQDKSIKIKAKSPRILRKFEALRQRHKPLYTKAYELIKVTTDVL